VEKMAEGKSTFGLDKNVACAVTYVLGWVSGLIFFLAEKEDKEVRFHAVQAIILFGALTILSMIPVIGWALSPFLCLAGFVLWLVLILKAYKGEKVKLSVIGDWAEKWAGK